MSFLQRLKNRGVRSGQASLQSDSEETAVDKVAQLDVDVYQTEKMIVIYAQSSGADMNDVNVSIEGDADIVLIDGIFTKKIISFTSIESVVLIKYIHIPKYLSPKDINYFYTKQKALNLVQTRNFFLSNSNYEQLIEICR